MSKELLINLKEKIDEAIILWDEWVLASKDAHELQDQLRDTDLLKYFENKIIKLKFEKLQESIDPIWSNRQWYTWSWFLKKRNELIEIELINENTNKQVFFWEWEEKKIYNYLRNLFQSSNEKIIIYDNYINSDLLKVLSDVEKHIKIEILTTEKSKSNKFEKQIWAFRLLYELEINIKYIKNWPHPSHDRYYIIDNQNWVYSLWASLWKKIRATIFHPVDVNEGLKILKNIEKWWKNDS
jgi:hypothetical protein